MGRSPRWAIEVAKMVVYVTMPVFTVWVFNKDFFKENVTYPAMKGFLSPESYREYMIAAHEHERLEEGVKDCD